MKQKLIFIFYFWICSFGFSQEQNLLNDNFFVREITKHKDVEYFLATEQKEFGYLLKIDKNSKVDTLAALKGNSSLNGFNTIFFHKNRIYLCLDKLKELEINNTQKFSYSKNVHNILCFDLKGKLLWQNYFEPKYTFGASDFKFVPTNKKNVRLGFNSYQNIVVNKDTIGSEKGDRQSFFLELDKNGKFIDVLACSKHYKSSILFSLINYRSKQLALMLNYTENQTLSNREIFNINDNITDKYIITGQLNIEDIYVFDKYFYVLTFDNELLRYRKNKLKNSITITNHFIPESSKRADFPEKHVFDNGKYLTFVCSYEIRDKNSKATDHRTLENIHFEIRHINKKDLTIQKSHTISINTENRWAKVTSCNENEMKILIGGKYRKIVFK